MNDDDLIAKIQKVIKDELRPTKELVEVIKRKVDGQELYVRATSSQVSSIKEQQSVMNEKLDEHSAMLKEHSKILEEQKDTLENRVLPSVVYIEQNIKAYSDMYKINNDNMKKLEKRNEILEEQAGINPAEEYLLSELPG